MADTCTHLDSAEEVTPSSDGCDWWWCYADDLFFEVGGAPPADSNH